ncbi:uncharacterized protein LOC123518455 isoform X2 [Portunus trituberculatus]|uniref:uncharacterized protein LOC123518455 isoform X2 n=1 Tax=Portunus trituberculatus TaxID=210409 RepID=UPI001E1D1D38|nr:uncharacterized protein LOC123518455 isoform X2 [Portunus trituberculatus]
MAPAVWLRVGPLLLLMMVLLPGSGAQGGEVAVEGLLRAIVQKGLNDCHLAVVGYGPSVIASILRGLDGSSASVLPRTVVDVAESWQGRGDLLAGVVRGDVRAACRLLVAQAKGRGKEDVFQFLEVAGLYEWEETFVVLVGEEEKEGEEEDVKGNDIEEILLHHTFRNTHFLLYLVPLSSNSLHPVHQPHPVTNAPTLTTTASVAIVKNKRMELIDALFLTSTAAQKMNEGLVKVYTRCLYCDGGSPAVRLLYTWRHSSAQQQTNSTSFFPGPLRNLKGHRLRIVSMEWFPFIDYKRSTPEGGAVVTPRDSLDYRMLKDISKRLNFTYVMRAPWDNQWGTSTDSGNWTGVVGTLQYQKADFSMMLSYMPTRLPVVQYSRIYASEPLVMVTSKPRPLSQSFALVRPFSGEVWMLTLTSAMAAGVVLWGLQRVWAWVAGREKPELGRSMMTTWGILLEDPPVKLPANPTGQSSTVESLADLLEAHRRERWTWGYEPTYGSGWEWLKINESPTVRTVFKSLMLVGLDEQLARVLRGRHAFITWKYYIRSVVAARFKGASPLHTAREELFNYGGYGWGFRKGAPFRSLMDGMKIRLVESGVITTWLDQLVLTPHPSTPTTVSQQKPIIQEEEGADRVVLGLGHLQGAFYLLVFGLCLAFAAFLVEALPWFRRDEDTKNS